MRILHVVVVFAVVAASAGVSVASSAQSARGTISEPEVVSESAGSRTLRRTPPDDSPDDVRGDEWGLSDRRIRWAPEEENFPTWTDPDRNTLPAAPLFEHTITGLDSEAAHNVRTRAGDDNGASAASPWSGPWLEAAPVAAAPLGSAEATDDPSFNEQQSVAAERVADESVAEDGVADDSGAEHRFSDADSANIAAQKTRALTTRQNGNSAPAFADDAALVYVTPLDTLGDATGDTTNVSADRLAQPFQTGGTTADSFAVNKVEVPMAVPDGITVGVEIWSNFRVVARPDSRLFTLSAPAAFDNDVATVEEFEASEVSLTGGTWYWLVFSRMPAGGSGNIRIPRRDSGVVFTDESSGWGLRQAVLPQQRQLGELLARLCLQVRDRVHRRPLGGGEHRVGGSGGADWRGGGDHRHRC